MANLSLDNLNRMNAVVHTLRNSLSELGFVEVFAPAKVISGSGGADLAPSSVDFLAASILHTPRVFALARSARRLDNPDRRRNNELTEMTYLQAWLASSLPDAVAVALRLLESVHRESGVAFNSELPHQPFNETPSRPLALAVGPEPSDEPAQPDLREDESGKLLSMDIVSRHAGEIGSVAEVAVGSATKLDAESNGQYAKLLASIDGPVSRVGLGIERLLMHLSDADDITECVPFAITSGPPIVSVVQP